MAAFWNPSTHLLTPNEDGHRSENDILFTIEYFALTSNQLTGKYIEAALSIIETAPGLFQQHPEFAEFTDPDTKFTSHDNLTAIMSYVNQATRTRIWEEIKRQGFRYDNQSPQSPSIYRQLHPRDIIYYGILGGSEVMWVLFPLLSFMCWLSCRSSESTGALLVFLRCIGMRDNSAFQWLFRKCTNAIVANPAFGSWDAVFKTYFLNPEHPIHKFLNEGEKA